MTETKLTVDFGGGIKTDEDIEVAFNHGASMEPLAVLPSQNQTVLWGGWRNTVLSALS